MDITCENDPRAGDNHFGPPLEAMPQEKISVPSKTADLRIEASIDSAVEPGEKCLKVAVWHEDDLAIDTWCGLADVDAGNPVDECTAFPVFSAAIADKRMFGNVPPMPGQDHPFTAIGDAVRAVIADRIAGTAC